MASEIDLRTQLPVLYGLQELDERIRRLQEQRRILARRLKNREVEFEKRQQDLNGKKSAYQALQVEQHRKNTELLAGQERLKKYQEQQKNARDANEYAALDNQMARTKEQLDALEERAIEILLSLDPAKAELDTESARFSAYQEEYQQERKRALLAMKKLDAELERVGTAREAQAVHVHPSLLSEYQVWRDRKGTTLVARIAGETCGGCNMGIPPQIVLEAREFRRAYYCPSCHRLLYAAEQ